MKSPETKILGLALLIVGLVLCGIGISWLLRPPQFQATARIQVQQTENYISPSSPSMEMGFDPYFIQTTFAVLQSEVVLSNVISTLDLNNKWGMKYNHGMPLKLSETINILKGNMILKPVRNTKLIAITAYSDDPKEAADIANAIAVSYQNYRIQTRKQLALNALKSFQEDYENTEKKVQILQSNVDELRKNFSVVGDPEISTFSTNTADAVKNQSYYDAKLQLDQMQDQQRLFRAKIDATRIDVMMPKNSMVQIVDPAEPPKSPVGPNRFLGAILLAVGLVSMLGGWLLLKPEHETAD